MDKKTNKKKFVKPSVATTVFNKQYTYHITKIVLEKFGESYQTAENIKNLWRKKIEVSYEIGDFIIFKTKSFIRLLDNPNSRNQKLLKKELKEQVKRKNIKDELTSLLYDRFGYIKCLLSQIEEKKNKRNNSNNYHKKEQLVKTKKQKKNNNHVQQITDKFNDNVRFSQSFLAQRAYSNIK